MAVKKDIVLKQVDPSLPPLLDFHLPPHPRCHTEPHGSARLSQAEVTRTPAPAVVQAQGRTLQTWESRHFGRSTSYSHIQAKGKKLKGSTGL